jgi:hypothetical protein
MGRFAEVTVALATPTPGASNANPAAEPLTSFAISDTVITATVTAEPGFLYVVEVSDDLLEWERVGGSILATGNEVTFTKSITAIRRFYRFRRTP